MALCLVFLARAEFSQNFDFRVGEKKITFFFFTLI